MKYLRTHKYLILFLIIIFIIGLLLGIILFIKQDKDIINSILYSIDNIKETIINNNISIIKQLLIIITLILLSFIFIGFFMGLFYLFSIGIAIGYTITLLTFKYGLNGLLFGILYNLYTKMLFLLLFIIMLIKIKDIIKNIIGYLIYHNKNLINNLKYNIYRIIILLILIIISNLLILITSNFVLKKLITMI